jgi:hypothetical protein
MKDLILSNPIRKAEYAVVYNSLIDLLGYAYSFCKQPIVDEQIKFEATELMRTLQSDYGMFSFKDVQSAFEQGLRGHYGQYYGLNMKTYCQFLTAKKSDLQEHNKQLKVYTEPKYLEPSEAEKQAIFDKAVKTCYTHYKSTGNILDYGNKICERLGKEGKIKMQPGEWENLLDYVRVVMANELQNRLNKTASINEVRTLKEQLRELPNKKDWLKSEAMNLLLKKHFNENEYT